jgi:hypothetical protein
MASMSESASAKRIAPNVFVEPSALSLSIHGWSSVCITESFSFVKRSRQGLIVVLNDTILIRSLENNWS